MKEQPGIDILHASAPQQPHIPLLTPPFQCCSSFILLRADPALNHSICVSLKLWMSSSVSSLPSLCFKTAWRGWTEPERDVILTGINERLCWSRYPGVMPTYFSWSESFEASDGDFVIWADLVIVWWVAEGQWQQTLLLQVGFCGRDEGVKTEEAAFKRSQFKYISIPWILAKLLTMMALPPRCRGSSAACSLLEPSP